MFKKCNFVISNLDMAIDMIKNDELEIAQLLMTHALAIYDSCNLLEWILIRRRVNKKVKIIISILGN